MLPGLYAKDNQAWAKRMEIKSCVLFLKFPAEKLETVQMVGVIFWNWIVTRDETDMDFI